MSNQSQGIYDARSLGRPKFFVLGIQHLFAMFGATVLVPLITGLDVSATLLFAGIGTLIFHLVSQFKVPAFLGSSFAFLGGYACVKQMGMAQGLTEEMALNYACIGVAAAALMYFVMAFLLKMFGTEKLVKSLNDLGIKAEYYESTGTDHEWLTWRRGLKKFIPHLFK
jgi:uracil permease